LLAHHPDNRLDQPAIREICNEFRRRALLLPQPVPEVVHG
jgi:hypothetical protein